MKSTISFHKSSGVSTCSYSCFSFPHSSTIRSINLITSLFTSCALKIASIILSSGTSFAPASIMITFSAVEATVSARSETNCWSAVGFTINSPSIRPILVPAIGPSNGISEIDVATEAPSIAVTSGEQSGSTAITKLFRDTSFL